MLFQVAFIDLGLDMVLGEDLHHLGLGRGLAGRYRLKAVLHRQLIVGRPRHLGDHHIHPGVPEIQGLGVPLGAEADNGHLLAL